jgi:hypothetical protein
MALRGMASIAGRDNAICGCADAVAASVRCHKKRKTICSRGNA